MQGGQVPILYTHRCQSEGRLAWREGGRDQNQIICSRMEKTSNESKRIFFIYFFLKLYLLHHKLAHGLSPTPV